MKKTKLMSKIMKIMISFFSTLVNDPKHFPKFGLSSEIKIIQ